MHAIQVSCYSGFKGEERPAAFQYRGKELRVEEIIDRWIEHSVGTQGSPRWCFRLRADDDHEYILSYDPSQDGWYMIKERSL